ncbi:MAG: hypothetical protein D6715_07520 [Calditrichaeota bacterium]|nr:MAG: hypothetical protein D6715_07520 [Calditrichota bacterium]
MGTGKRMALWFLVLILTSAGLRLRNSDAGDLVPSLLEQANFWYSQNEYHKALDFFQQALAADSLFVLRLPNTLEKLAHCYFQVGAYQQAFQRFRSPKFNGPDVLADYRYFYAARAVLAMGDTTRALDILENFSNRFPESPLIPLADSLRAELYFQQKRWPQAKALYVHLLSYRQFDAGDIYAHLISLADRLNESRSWRKYVLILLKNYPFHPAARSAYLEFLRRQGKSLTAAQIKALFVYLTRTGQVELAASLLRDQQRRVGKTELLRWLNIKLEYEQGHFRRALDACRWERRHFRSRRYLREVDLHIARCYLRLGETEKSIKAYARFQKRYPRDPIAAEVLWKIAWLYEELQDPTAARTYYQKLIQQYPRSGFVTESRFRTGLSFYRQAKFKRARLHWQNGTPPGTQQTAQARFQYWIAKAYLKDNDAPMFLKSLETLARHPFDSYYNLKAFLLTKNGGSVHHLVDSLLWEMHHQQVSYLPDYLNQFRRVLWVEEVFGKRLARREVEAALAADKPEDWQQMFALAELQERVKNYGRAYRLFRRIYLRHFTQVPWEQWTFLFKRLYPLYFEPWIQHYARLRNINPAAVWAVIKKESAFEPEIVSYADAYGLMQIIPPTARQIARQLNFPLKDLRQLFEPETNIRMGTYYLQQLLHRYQGNMYHALAAYNAGPHRVDRWLRTFPSSDDDLFMENIEFEQTRTYVRVTMRYYWTYYLLIYPDRIPEDLLAFPERVTHQPWYEETRPAIQE